MNAIKTIGKKLEKTLTLQQQVMYKFSSTKVLYFLFKFVYFFEGHSPIQQHAKYRDFKTYFAFDSLAYSKIGGLEDLEGEH
jgi:hypothetical protein